MPVLDLKVRVDKCQEIPRISYTFYKKEIASKYTILKRSAISMNTKRTTLFQEGLRHMSHVSHRLPWSKTTRHMSEWSNTMRVSGYNEKEKYKYFYSSGDTI